MFLNLDTPAKDAPGFEVLTSAQMREADRLTIAGGMDSYDLMTAAGQSVANVVHELYPGYDVLVLCGPGNNGGDGFVAARFMEEVGHKVTVMALATGLLLKGDAKRAYKDWGGKALGFKALPELAGDIVVIDAVFGTGLSKPLQPVVANIFDAVKERNWPVVAVDIPSGVNGDTGMADPHAVKAVQTVTFFRKKAGHVLMPGLELCGAVSVHDIGIADAVLRQTGFALMENDPALWRGKMPRPDKGGHKYGRGHVVILGGARMTGAARMASEAAMRSGAGLCTIAADKEAAAVYQRGAAHVLYEELAGYGDFVKHLEDKRRNVAVLGPGAGLDDKEGLRRAVLATLETKRAVVLDADALTCFEGHAGELLAALHDQCVLTPHEGEFARLFPGLEGGKLDKALKASEMTEAVLLLKGPDTVIAQRGGVPAVNVHATPWLATAGAGDVLAGIIAGLMAQNMGAFDAVCAASWIHGEAGERKGPGLVAPDIIENIPNVLKDLI